MFASLARSCLRGQAQRQSTQSIEELQTQVGTSQVPMASRHLDRKNPLEKMIKYDNIHFYMISTWYYTEILRKEFGGCSVSCVSTRACLCEVNFSYVGCSASIRSSGTPGAFSWRWFQESLF